MSWKKNLTVLTSLAGAASIGIHLINKTIYLSATSDKNLDTNEGNYYNWKFGNIFYTKQGEGKPLLLIHDLSTFSSGYEWNKLVKSLSKTNTVYTIDLLGCGRSDKPSITYTNFLYVQMLNDFIENVIEDKTDVIATGISGSFALGACHNNVEIIDKIIMINPPSINSLSKAPNSSTKLLMKLINLPLVGTLLYNLLTKETDLDLLLKEKYYSDSNKVDEKTKKIYYEAAHIGNAESKHLFASIKGNYLTANIPLYMEGLNNSIYIINGEELLEQYSCSRKYEDILPSIETVEIDDAKYLPQLECPEEVLNYIHIFFEE